jgi:hypothetical protein
MPATLLPVRREAGEVAQRLGCVARSTGTVSIDFGIRGCFGGSDNRFVLTHIGDGFEVEGFLFRRHDSRARVSEQTIRDEIARGWLKRLASALSAPETTTGCWSSARQYAHLVIDCECAGSSSAFDFNSSGCGQGGEHLHADAIGRLATAALSSLELVESGLSDAERAEERRKWSTVYQDGLRIRHDPIERWELDGGDRNADDSR